MKATFDLHVNGGQHTVSTEEETPLLYVLRNELALDGPKSGCGLQQCGACMVLLDGHAQPSCMISAYSVREKKITTLEGIAPSASKLHPVQQAFIKQQAAQCGYCLNGMVISAVSLLAKNPSPDDAAIREGMQTNLCRCGSYARIMRAVKSAAAQRSSIK